MPPPEPCPLGESSRTWTSSSESPKSVAPAFGAFVTALGREQAQPASPAGVLLDTHCALNLLAACTEELTPCLGAGCCFYVNKLGDLTREPKQWKNNIKLLPEVGQGPGTWDISDLISIGSWSWLKSIRSCIGHPSLGVILPVKFLLRTRRPVPSSQTHVQNAVLFLSRCFPKAPSTMETELTMAEGPAKRPHFSILLFWWGLWASSPLQQVRSAMLSARDRD